jgi:glutathione S-transferase
MPHLHAALITALSVLLLGFAGGLVGRARGRYGIHAPAISGHPDFERAFRAHQNTLEQIAGFLPALWLATLYGGNEMLAAWLGYAWLVGRLVYILGYVRNAKARGPGFLIGMLALVMLLVLALKGILPALFA